MSMIQASYDQFSWGTQKAHIKRSVFKTVLSSVVYPKSLVYCSKLYLIALHWIFHLCRSLSNPLLLTKAFHHMRERWSLAKTVEGHGHVVRNYSNKKHSRTDILVFSDLKLWHIQYSFSKCFGSALIALNLFFFISSHPVCSHFLHWDCILCCLSTS